MMEVIQKECSPTSAGYIILDKKSRGYICYICIQPGSVMHFKKFTLEIWCDIVLDIELLLT